MKRQDKFSFIRYANCWEDGETVRKALLIKEGEVGLSVASGGDNTLFLLSENPAKLYAFDLNETELFLTELKAAAIGSLPYEEVLSFLGLKKGADRGKTFLRLRGTLSERAFTYFKERPRLIENGVIHAGKFERYFRLFKKGVCPLFCRGERLREFCTLSDRKEQKAFYDRYIDNARFRLICKIFFGVKVMGRLGRDKSFFTHVKDKKDVGGDIKKRFEFGISHTKNRTNPYLSYILRGGFTKQALPPYLRRERFERIRKNLDRLVLLHGSLMDVEIPEKIDFFNLSDIFEYMSDEEFRENERRLSGLSAEGARIAYRNMQNERFLTEELFSFDERSGDLFREDRSFFYRDFLVYRKKGV